MDKVFRYLPAVAVLALAAPVSAATVTLSQQSGDIFGSNGRAAVNVTATADPSRSYNGTGGAFALTGSDGIGAITSFCVDLLQYLTLPGEFTVSAVPATFPASRSAALERLFETGFKGLDLTDNAKSAGFQLAVWEVAFESDGVYDIDAGNFKSNWASGGNAAAAFAKQLLAGMAGPITQNYQLTYFLSDTRQDQVAVSAVPLPAAGWLMLAGLGGLAAWRRKTREI